MWPRAEVLLPIAKGQSADHFPLPPAHWLSDNGPEATRPRLREPAAPPVRSGSGGVPDFELIRDFLIAFGLFAGAGFGLPVPEELAMVGAGLWTASMAEH